MIKTTRLRFLQHVAPIILVAGFAAHAIAATPLPEAQNGPASAARAQHDIMDRNLAPNAVPNVVIKGMNIQSAPAGAEKITFTLHSITLTGAEVYTAADLKPIYESKIGKKISLADVYGIAADLTRKYRNDGYVLTQVVVPPQKIEHGDVTLKVVEGYIDNVEVRGFDDPSAVRTMRDYAAHVRSEGKAVNISDLERAMLLINDLPGVTARGTLSPSPHKVGAADLLIDETRTPYTAQVGIDNYGSRFLGPWQGTAAIALNSLFGLNERITGQFVVAPGQGFDSELWYGGLDYEQPIFTDGTTMEFFGSETFTHPNYLLRQFDVHGRSGLIGGRIKHPFIRTRDLTLTSRITVDGNNVDTGDNIEDARHDRIRSVRLGTKVEYLDTFLSAAFNSVDIEVSHGMDILGARSKNDLNVSRPGATPDYNKVDGEIQRLQRLFPDVNLLLGAAGQWANDTLYTSEEFGFGGSNYGRGFDPSEIVGDSGVAGKAELQWNNPIKFSYITKYQMFAFYDVGRVWDNAATTSTLKRSSAASTGIGTRVDFTPQTTGGALVAFPLTHGVQSEDGHRDARFLLSLYHKF